MNEEQLVRRICEWFKKQGFSPETNVRLGKRGRKIQVDIYVDRNPQRSLAIEVKKDKKGIFDGIGKALFYATYTDCEVWLAMPTNMCKLAMHLNPLHLPFRLFDTTHMQLVPDTYANADNFVVKIYICPLCGEKVGDVTKKNWLNVHLINKHGVDVKEMFEALSFYKLAQRNELKSRLKYAEIESEGGESEWQDEWEDLEW